MKICAIDIGSNSVRLATVKDGKTLYKRFATTRLGEGISSSGRLNAQAVDRTARAVADFVHSAQREGADRIYAFATAAVRSSSNGAEFLLAVKKLCGIEVEVLSGETEAKCGVLGAVKGGDGGIIDVGGASTEVSVKRANTLIYAESVDIGAVRLLDIAGRDIAALGKAIDEKTAGYGSFDASAYKMYAIGGTATTIASVKQALKVYDPEITDGTRVSVEEVMEMAERLLSLGVEQVKNITGMEPRRADVIGGGCLLMGKVMRRFNVAEITVSESDNIEGYIMLKEGAL